MEDGIITPWLWHDHDMDFARWLHPAMWHVAQSGIMTVNSPSGSTMQCDTWFWDDMPASRGKNVDWITTKVFDWSMESTAAVGVAIHSVIFGTSCTRIIQWWFRHWASHSVSVPGNRLIFSGTNASRRHIVLVGHGKVWYLWSVLGCDDSVTQWEMTTSTEVLDPSHRGRTKMLSG